MRTCITGLLIVTLASAVATAAPTSTTSHGVASTDLNGMIKVGDLLSGKIGTELPPLYGWHPANSNPADQLPAFTDDLGMNPPGGAMAGLTGLLNDFPAAGTPAKTVQYDLGAPTSIGSIGILTGNNGQDGRIFSTTVIKYSTDNGGNFQTLGYFQSDPSGTLNNSTSTPRYGSTYVTIFDNASATLLAGVTNLQFFLYAVDNTQGQMRDPYDGVNPYTGLDDGLSAPNTSPLVLELDAVVVPEPVSLTMLALGGLLLGRRRRLA